MKRIEFPLEPQMQGPSVADLQAALTLLGFTIAGEEETAQHYGASTRRAVSQFQQAHQLHSQQPGAVDEATASVLNRLLEERGVLDGQENSGDRRVQGTVRHVDGSAIGGLQVCAFHLRLAAEDVLGTATTNERGKYLIDYSLPLDAPSIDLFLRAYDSSGGVVGTSAIRIGASVEEELDLTVADDRFRGPSEFQRLSQALAPLLRSADMETLDADDVALLVRKTGLPRVQVTAWIAAARLIRRAPISHEVLYALIRARNIAALPRLLGCSRSRLREQLVNAAKANVVSRSVEEQADALVSDLVKVAVDISASPDTPGSLGRLLATATHATSAQQYHFIERYFQHEGSIQEFWRALRADPAFGDRVVNDLQSSVQLGAFSQNHPPLVKALRPLLAERQRWRGAAALGDIRVSDVALLAKDDWLNLLATEIDGQPVGTPERIVGTTEEERRDRYASLLTERAILAFPTIAVGDTLVTTPGWERSSVISFVEANPKLDLANVNLKILLDSGEVVIPPGVDPVALERDLLTTQRVVRIAPPAVLNTTVGGLLEQGYHSALSITRKSQATFVRHTAAALGGEETAKQVYRNAHLQLRRSLAACGSMHPALFGPTTSAVGDPSLALAQNPTWSSLFGSVDYCACEHCRSIFSPAAYLVDLLAWLEGRDAYELFDQRRPDIKHIELSCENTNTVMPYVDLVNEILEDQVLHLENVAPGITIPSATTATSEELLANPEALQTKVYDTYLRRAVYPWNLPFDLWGELARVYLDHLGAPRFKLIDALHSNGTRSDTVIAAERLQLSGALWNILTGAGERDTWEYWGYSAEESADGVTNYRDRLAVVSIFLDRAAIEYSELLDLLHTRFANTNGIVIAGDECSTDARKLERLSDRDLDRMQRFLRLWRSRGGSMLDLDKTLFALNGAPFDDPGQVKLDEAALLRLADLEHLLELTRAPLLDVLCWWSELDTFKDRAGLDDPVKPLYDRVFLNRSVHADAENDTFPLALDESRSRGELLKTDLGWDDVLLLPELTAEFNVRSALQAALGISADDLALLLDAEVNGGTNPNRVVSGETVTLADLSNLYRHVSLARTLTLTLSELFGLLGLTGRKPFNLANTRATVDFVEEVAEIRASEFSFDDLHYLLEQDAIAETRVGVTDAAIGMLLVEMRDALARIDSEISVTSDPTGSLTQQYLTMILTADSVPEGTTPEDGVAAVMDALRTEGTDTTAAQATLTLYLLPLLPDVDPAVFFQSYDSSETRFGGIATILAAYLRATQKKALVIEKLATFTGLGLDAVEDLLTNRVFITVDSLRINALTHLQQASYVSSLNDELIVDDDPDTFAMMRLLYKVATVLLRLEVSIDEQKWLFDTGVASDLLDLTTLPTTAQDIAHGVWRKWTKLLDLFALRTALPGGEPSLVELLALLEETPDFTPTEDEFLTSLASRTAWRRDDIDALVAAFGFQSPGAWRDGQALRRLVEAFVLIHRIGASAAQVGRWASAPIGSQQAEEIRLAAKAKHPEAQWPEIARALRDPIRDQQRAALVAYLLANDNTIADVEDLYSRLLIDVEMSSCMLTSRIKQAIGSVQLFIVRAFLNLEAGVTFTRADRDQWEWMKNYRVWEANRKVFLYPENWIEPELRDTKSLFFEQLESQLLRGELTDEAAELAYLGYLESLLSVARLEVMGVYHEYEDDEDGETDLLHVVARSRAAPRTHWYRQWVDRREWTPWEKLDLDIEGDHVIVALHDRRLMVLWPVAVQKAEGQGGGTETTGVTNYYELHLAWTERFNGQWSPKKLSEEFIQVNEDFGYYLSTGVWLFDDRSVYFRLAHSANLVIECRRNGRVQRVEDTTTEVEETANSFLLGTFTLDTCSGSMVVSNDTQEGLELVRPYWSLVRRMRFRLPGYSLTGGTQATLGIMDGEFDDEQRLVGTAEEVTVLGRLADNSTYLYPHQYGEFASQHGVFLDDDGRTFFVMPERRLATQKDLNDWFGEDAADPADVEWLPEFGGYLEFPPRDTPTIDYVPEIDWELLDEQLSDPRQRIDPPRTLGPVSAQRAVSVTPVADASTQFADLGPAQLGQTQFLLETTARFMDPAIDMHWVSDYRFSLFYHPFVCGFIKQLRRLGVEGLLDPNPDGAAPELVRQQKRLDFFDVEPTGYAPTERALEPYPRETIAFDYDESYAPYNWEIFFHVPFLIANRLSQNQRFEEARRWYHFIFDPTNCTDEDDELRFWKIRPFYRQPEAAITEMLELAALDPSDPEVAAAQASLDAQIEASSKDPFDPHAIARLRPTAYQKAIVMKYLDNLIAWADQLFRRDTIETINEATQLYAIALALLGDRPADLPPNQEPVAISYCQVREQLDSTTLNNPLVALENELTNPTTAGSVVSSGAAMSGDQVFYFCIPPNEKLLGYWDTVADRLFKIRHCMNIEGVVRQLPLFEPPIDPGMLVRAAAAGVDLTSALSNLNAPLPHYRFSVMLQKAYALNQTVRGLGGALLSALEKEDAEALSNLRASHEVAVLEAVRQVKKLAIDEAKRSLEAAEKSLEVIDQRRDYYKQLIEDGWLANERDQVRLLKQAGAWQMRASVANLLGTTFAPIPRVSSGGAGTMGTPFLTVDPVDGAKLAKVAQIAGQSLSLFGMSASTDGSLLGINAGYKRRQQEWDNQLQLALKEHTQITKQVEAARIRVALAEKDAENHDRQIENAKTVRTFMEDKFTSQELYTWMVGQLSALYFQSYQLAYDLAQQAERAYRHELALADATFIQFGYWDSLKKGLLAGERLQYDLERMDATYLENNRREYEITKHISLAALDPVALLNLTTTGVCEFSIPEAVYDLDYPGQYLRRIKSVSMTVPCVTGPYTGLPCRLTLVSSRTRIDPSAAGDYAFMIDGDSRFQVDTGAAESIVMSSGREDSGLFTADHRDERYLPFEGRGAISDWSLKLTSAAQTFDWSTISDVVLHVRYTSREGGDLLRYAAIGALNAELAGIPLRCSFSARYTFPSEWRAFLQPAQDASAAELKIGIDAIRFPYIAHDASLAITALEVVALVKDVTNYPLTNVYVTPPGEDPEDRDETPEVGLVDTFYGGQPSATVSYTANPKPLGTWTIRLSIDSPEDLLSLDDLVIVVTYSITIPVSA